MSLIWESDWGPGEKIQTRKRTTSKRAFSIGRWELK
mgnify:CR=1 FL=1